MPKDLTVEINEQRGTVKLVIIERPSRGGWINRTQHTFSRRQFEKALREAEVTVPWDAVMKPIGNG